VLLVVAFTDNQPPFDFLILQVSFKETLVFAVHPAPFLRLALL
jgi:hypothetical protein